ncbi:DNA-processing protein DprA [Arachidicoccus ginsenosidimutans]|uniref:DNA-processing protein DprA n=1 Tax=Arachidicoccus sp. BS20 TaxID=1850526 RepID=UPI0009EE47E1|nr:DNA-processing protein DprA [Arachidicoccus sp. BS20]
MNEELKYQIALTLVPSIGVVTAKKLIEHFGDAQTIFSANKKDLRDAGIASDAIESIKTFDDFSKVDEEILFIKKYKIQTFFITQKDYPQRLLNCYDPPVLLYYKGNSNLNDEKIVSIIGTRNNTPYGKKTAEEIVEKLSVQNILIVSGLAYGIDTIAHKAALKNNLQTIGVLANGLKTIYPSENKKLAEEMLAQGGLLSEFSHDTKPDRYNFPRRNRIVAGMADATIVVETSRKGGSMITAEIANSYGREIFAVPGRIGDEKSNGCNYLIQSNKAQIFTDTEQFLYAMNWNNSKKKPKQQTMIFADLSLNEQKVVDVLRTNEALHIDTLKASCGLSSGELASAMLTLELAGIIVSLPGKLYQLA